MHLADSAAASPTRPLSMRWSWALLREGLLVALGTLLLFCVLYQLPTQHTVNIGHYDTAYVQGFYGAQEITPTGGGRFYLDGSDGSARWSQARSFLLFPQAGLPSSVTLRLVGWRADGPPPQLQILSGTTLLAELQTSGDWQQIDVALPSEPTSLLRASDVVLELRTETAPLPNDGREVGVLLDQAIYRVSPGAANLIWPYPTQLIYGTALILLVWLGLRLEQLPQRRVWLITGSAALIVGLAFLFLVRLSPPLYPYPIRWLLPYLLVLILALLGLRHLPRLLAVRSSLLTIATFGGIGLWCSQLWLASQQHVTLAVPGVEKDFRVFATRTTDLAAIFRADGFYNLGYPLLLWLVQPLTQLNPFLAGRLIAVLSGALLLLATWWLATRLLADLPNYRQMGAALAVLCVAANPLVVEQALSVGSDMPFAAFVTLALALFVSALTSPTNKTKSVLVWLVLAGAAAGAAFLVRHLGLALLLWGALVLLIQRRPWRTGVVFAAGFLLIALPQFAVNLHDTGDPLYNEQAKNIWLAVYTGVDWGRWGEVPDTISLINVFLRDPLAFLANWGQNMGGFLGTGAVPFGTTSQALQLQLLAWPANWLAVLGLLAWLWQTLKASLHQTRPLTLSALTQHLQGLRATLPGFVLLYVALVALAFLLPRFMLPLIPIYAVAAAWLVGHVTTTLLSRSPNQQTTRLRWQLAILLLLGLLLQNTIQSGIRSVLARQPADEVAIINLALTTLQPGEMIVAELSPESPVAKYSALAHRVIPDQASTTELTSQHDWSAAQAAGAIYLLWDATQGDPLLSMSPNADQAHVGRAGPYTLYRLTP